MAKLGSYVFLFGVGTLILNLFQFDLFEWVDQWSISAGWTIRFAVVVAGLYLMEHGSQATDENQRVAEEYGPVAHPVV